MDDSTKQLRERILRQIRVVLSQLPPDVGSGTIRILGDTPNSILDPEDFLGSIRPFVTETEESLRKFHPGNETRFVAAKICRGKHSYFILDLNNSNYNYETAHECKTLIPVYVLRLSKRQPTIFRKRELDESIAKILRNMHNLHGQAPLPLFDNHYDPYLQYPNPRSPHYEV
ncbi:hypothetical protein BO79DRAFT_289501 [Aspergillus costaricaensis CBS 115574]|uniref:Uncharacterized protein n=1 Tax=Aspergillus costaricaensis CBS 115574 TaxID=1448317 RepID=A0ACD1I6P4_9EURO|nr:hypothetical protein BO79DRAFT_289501 [Aspergillus costaricaensis CBS 115574]RAK85988.1 hypothetical protein BO79DRAFT_289501 [Aspergillus costaricaensis CBS 115574]